MKWSERQIASFLARVTFAHKNLVMVPNCSWPGAECDLLVVTSNMRVIDVEIKVSRADLKADQHKEKWWHYLRWKPGLSHDSRERRQRREWPANVWKHYYCLPAEIWTPELLPHMAPASGVLLIYELKHEPYGIHIRVERMAAPNRKAPTLDAEDAIDLARLASLRMWDALQTVDDMVRERAAVPA